MPDYTGSLTWCSSASEVDTSIPDTRYRLRSIWPFKRGAHRLTAIAPISGLIAWTPPALGERAGASRSPIIFQIVMRKVDGWQTIAEKPSDQIIDLAHDWITDPPGDASPNSNTTRDRTQ